MADNENQEATEDESPKQSGRSDPTTTTMETESEEQSRGSTSTLPFAPPSTSTSIDNNQDYYPPEVPTPAYSIDYSPPTASHLDLSSFDDPEPHEIVKSFGYGTNTSILYGAKRLSQSYPYYDYDASVIERMSELQIQNEQEFEGEEEKYDYKKTEGETYPPGSGEGERPPSRRVETLSDEDFWKSGWRDQEIGLEHEDRKRTPSPPGTPKDTLPKMHESPSIESFLKLGETVQVHFRILPEQKLFSEDIRIDRTIGEIKNDISPIFKVPPEFIDIRKNRNLVMDYKTLKDLGGKPKELMKFTVEMSKRCITDLALQIPEDVKVEEFPTVVRNVQIESGNYVQVTIEFANEEKPFIGGYRDKRSDILYHHAHTQTPFQAQPYPENAEDFSCQAFDNTPKAMQTVKDEYSQTYRIDYHVSCLKEKIIWGREYLSSEYIDMRRQKAIIIIQKYWRRWLAIRERKERMKAILRRVQWAENLRKKRIEQREAITQDEMWRQHHPSKMVDIELLYRAINEWRREQVEYVELHRWGADRKAALAVITENEADLLLDLERTKQNIRNACEDSNVQTILKKVGNPTRWLNRSGNFISLDNDSKEQMRQHHKLFNSLKSKAKDEDERLQVLDRVVECVKPMNSDLSKYLIDLIAREKVLLSKNAGQILLVGLRQRINNTFFHFLRHPNFNPECKKLQEIPYDSHKLRKDMLQCRGCRRMRYRDQFTISRGVTVTSRCVTCMSLYRTCILRTDLNLYRRMLAELRQDEQMAGVDSSVTYLIDAYDMQFLVDDLWHAQSALSGIDDRYLLRMVRWRKDLPWTPWNCVLLTEEEAMAHLHIEDMNAAYQKSFFHKVQVKHEGARIYFARLTSLSIPLDTTLEAYCQNLKQKAKKGKKVAPFNCT